MEQIHRYESVDVEVININLASKAKPKVRGVEIAAEWEFLEDPEQLYYVTLNEIPVESSGSAFETPQNPTDLMQIMGGCLQRLANMEAVLPQTIAEEPSDFLRALVTSNASSLNMASIESGVLLSYDNNDSIIIVSMRGKMGPSAMNREDKTFTFPSEPQVSIVDPQNIREPHTWARKPASLDETPFSQVNMHLSIDDDKAECFDRAVSVVYDAKTDTTFVGFSRRVKFDRQDVKKTIEDREQHPDDPAYDRRVADNMLERLKAEHLVDDEGYYERMEHGRLVRRQFDVQNPHEYINPDFNRAWQIAEMEVVLFDSIKNVRRRAKLMQNASAYGLQPDFSRLIDTRPTNVAA